MSDFPALSGSSMCSLANLDVEFLHHMLWLPWGIQPSIIFPEEGSEEVSWLSLHHLSLLFSQERLIITACLANMLKGSRPNSQI